MAWIESHQEVARHPKTKRLARLLGEPLVAVIGRLHCLWWWALDYADDGDISRMQTADIADACQWDGDPDAFVDMLTQVGFLDREDGRLTIHDWDDYAGRLVERRRANVERTKRWRAEHERTTNAPVTHNERVGYRATVPDPTVPDRTVPEDVPETAPPAADAPSGAVPKPNRQAEVIDAIQAADVPLTFTPRDGAAIKQCSAPPGKIAAAYIGAYRGEWGNDWLRENLSVHEVINRLASADTGRSKNGHAKPGRGPGSRQESTTAQLIVDSRRRNIAVDTDEELADRPALLAEVQALEAHGWQR